MAKYPKQIMTITELVEMGYPRRMLIRYVHIPGFPARRISPEKNSPWLIDTDKFSEWYDKYGGRV